MRGAISRLPTADGLSRMNSTTSRTDGNAPRLRCCLGLEVVDGGRGI